jgi:diguanylate cyclase (GGDEF)-like protein
VPQSGQAREVMVRPVRARTVGIAPGTQAWLLIGFMGLVLVATFLLTPWRNESLRHAEWWVAIPLLVAYVVAERTAFDIEIGDQGHSFSLSAVPTAFGAILVAPLVAVGLRLLATGPLMYGPRRNRGVKLAFNLTSFATETSIAMLVPRLFVDRWGSSDSVLVIGVMAGIAASSMVAGVAIASVVSRYEGTWLQSFRVEVANVWWFYLVTSLFSGMSVAVFLIEPWLTLLLAPALFGLWWVLRSMGRLTQELRDLDAVHGFAGRLGRTLDTSEIARRAVADVAELVRADGAALVRRGSDGELLVDVHGHMPVRLPHASDHPTWAFLASYDDAQVVAADELRERDLVTDDRLKAVMISPVSDEGEIFAVMVATEANVQRLRFDDRDVARLRNMTDQLAVSLRRGLLHARLEYEARHDALTGLPARTLFELAVADALASPDRTDAAVMMLDLDRFKEVNDTLGHHAGDALLIEFSRRMSALLEPGDLLARLAGDEFAIVCRRTSPDEIKDLAHRCVAAGGSPVTLDGLEIVVTVSVGVALVHHDETDPLQPIRRADIAMYNAKWQRTSVELYRDEIDRRTPARLSMLGDLRAAIEQDEIDVVYQPKLDLRSREIVGVEALVRWDSPTRGVVAPSEFVRVAEDTGLIKELTDLVLEQGIRDLRTLEDLGLDLQMSINLSTHDLFDTQLPDRVRNRLDEKQVDADRLTLEITESSLLVDAPRTRATIDELHQAGIRLAVDDFGTGYSSLSYLRRLPVQELKIDQSFVSGMLTDPQDEVIVKSTVDLGRNLQLSVVAEGVEDEATLDALAMMGCDVGQGYGIARPLQLVELIDWVARTRRETVRIEADVAALDVDG